MELQRLIIDDPVRGIFRVHRSALTSPEILALERERIFDRCWLYLGHESEVERPGDYVRRSVAGRPILFVRSSDGQVRAFYNTCLHRGAMVCRKDKGNAEVFPCFYHAWTYNNKGELIGIPDEAGYAQGFDRTERALKSPPRMESYRGFIFVSFDPAVENLATYLADAKEYLDLIVDQAEEGMRVVSGAHSYSIRANWKLFSENSIDPYHVAPLHATYLDYMAGFSGKRIERIDPRKGWARALGNGHGVTESPTDARPIAKWHPVFGEAAKEEIERIRARLVERYGEERSYRMAETLRLLLIFPNLIIHDSGAITIRVWWPVTPDLMEVRAWALAPREETGEQLKRRLDNFNLFFGPGGFATPDDVEAIETCQLAFAAGGVEWSDLSRGMHRETESLAIDEIQVRSFWRQWYAQVQGLSRLEHSEVRVGR